MSCDVTMRYSNALNLADVIWDVACRHGGRTALWVRDETYNYGELTAKAELIAAQLLSQGIGRGDRVGILASRSSTAYVAILAALRAGCVFVPLNLRFPKARNLAMLDQAGAGAVIADREGLAALPMADLENLSSLKLVVTPGIPAPGSMGRVMAAGDCELAAVTRPAHWPQINRDDLCYLLFTSGSTGKPKGVPISHGNVLEYLAGLTQLEAITADDRIIQLVDLTFDLSAHDMFLAWTSGAALYSVPENSSIFATRFVEEHDLTWWLSVPSTAGLIKQRGLLGEASMPSLRVSFFCGEALPAATALAWAHAAPNSHVINLYGPTEATIAFSYFRVDRGARDLPGVVPLGHPIGTQAMAILDGNGAALAEGGTGELHLSGSQLTPGYWNAPDIDAERFIAAGGQRWYRTGDLARYDPEFGYIFAGRADHQVKIGGFRVELQEIETVVRAVSGCDVVAVVPWPLSEDGGALGCVAFIAGGQGNTAAVLAACREKLPDYMIPQTIIYLSDIPLNSNGKVDYLQLRKHPMLQTISR
jgi:D-alanine--poly(phosphoribitol) ligase subunit 1